MIAALEHSKLKERDSESNEAKLGVLRNLGRERNNEL